MPADLQTPDAALFTKYAAGDESALADLSRQQYDAMLAHADAALGPELGHFRGRIVQQAMLAAWAARGRFQNPVGLASYLAEAVKEQAAIQKRKHASLHRSGTHATAQPHVATPGVDEAVQQLMAVLHAPPPDHAQLQAEAREARKAHARDHVQAVGRKPAWVVPTVVFGVLAIAAVAGVRWFDANSGDVAADIALKTEGVRQQATGRGQRGSFSLGDETRVTMGSDTKLRIPKEFGSPKLRTVELIGTAQFTVAAGKPIAFSVRAANAQVTAASGAFTLRAFPEDSAVAVSVTDGSVEVRVRDGGSRQLSAGQAVRVTPDGQIADLAGDGLDVALAWVRDSIVFAGAPVSQVVPEIVRWFGINAVVGDSAVAGRPVTMRVALSSSGDATKALTEAASLQIQFGEDDRIEFMDAPPAPPAPAKRR